jgi:hypothetical protein
MRDGPTLIIDKRAPVSSEIRFTYLRASTGSCENFRADVVALFHPGIFS